MKPKTCPDCGQPWDQHTIRREGGYRVSLQWVCPRR